METPRCRNCQSHSCTNEEYRKHKCLMQDKVIEDFTNILYSPRWCPKKDKVFW